MFMRRKKKEGKKKNYDRTKENQISYHFFFFSPSPFLSFHPNEFCRSWVKCNDRVAIAILVLLRPVTSEKYYSSSRFFSIYSGFLFFFPDSKSNCVCLFTCLVFQQHRHLYILKKNRMNFNLKAAGTLLSRAKQVFFYNKK
jgi:hypothetical protein